MNAFSWFIRFFMHVSFNGKHAPDRETVFPVRVKKSHNKCCGQYVEPVSPGYPGLVSGPNAPVLCRWCRIWRYRCGFRRDKVHSCCFTVAQLLHFFRPGATVNVITAVKTVISGKTFIH